MLNLTGLITRIAWPMFMLGISGGDIFPVTQAGVDHVALNSPKPPIQPSSSRSQMRYQRFREYGESFDSFIDYCRWDADPARSWNGGVNSGGVVEGA